MISLWPHTLSRSHGDFGAASVQEDKGWLGADVLDVTKAEADKHKWNAPHGAKVGVVASGSPADRAGLKNGDIIDLADGVEVETSSTVEKTITANSPNTLVRLRAWSGGRERRIAVTLAEPPKMQADQGQSGLLSCSTPVGIWRSSMALP